MTPNQERLLIVIGSIIAVLLVVLVLILMTGDDPSDPVAATTVDSSTSTAAGADTPTTIGASTTTAAPTTTASPTTSTSTTTTTTTTAPAPSGACSGLPSAVIPGPEPGVSFASGDFDGDGNADQLIGYQDAGGTWWVQVALSYGYASETAVPGPVTAVGADDFGTGQDVGYAFVDGGASTQILGFVYLPGCDVFEATLGSGLARFPIGGGVTHLDGLTCVADGLNASSASTSDGTTWEVSSTAYDWVPGLGDFRAVSSAIALMMSPADDGVIFSSADFSCPDTSP